MCVILPLSFLWDHKSATSTTAAAEKQYDAVIIKTGLDYICIYS